MVEIQIQVENPQIDIEGRWEVIPWSSRYLIGHQDIDADHQKLFELFSEFVSTVNAGSDISALSHILDELMKYAKYHFSREEQLMRDRGYLDYQRHKKMHDTFTRQITEAGSRLAVGGSMSAFLLSFLSQWLAGHILGADRKLGAFLAADEGGQVISRPGS